MKKLLGAVCLIAVSVVLSGCLFPKTYKDGLIVDRQMQETTVVNRHAILTHFRV